MKLLDVSRESIYRRIRGEIPFTFEEISQLSVALGFSIDEIVGQHEKNRIFFNMQVENADDPSLQFEIMLRQYHLDVQMLARYDDTYIIHTQNRVPIVIAVAYPNIFRFYYFRWIHQLHDVPVNYSFSDVEIPDEVEKIRINIVNDTDLLRYNIFILDRSVYMNVIKEMQYYYRRKLITKEELSLLKDELMYMVNHTEGVAQRGYVNDQRIAKMDIYLSTMDIESNSISTEYNGGHTMSYFFAYAMNPMIVRDSEACLIHRKWMESIKKYSVFITQSNELLQFEFFSEQREYISKMDTEMY